jgi:protoheme IX farnesyltransferase
LKAAAIVQERPALFDFLELTKPRLTAFVLFVALAGGYLASGGHADARLLLHAVLGTAFVAGGGSAWNMLLEREADARMRRTWNRPLPAGRLRAREVALFGSVLVAVGLAHLAVTTTPAAALVAAATVASYVGVYTPLKRVTTLNTLVGAVPGALPALVGWSAVTGGVEPAGLALFLVVYVWQVPHFLAIAWLYRDDYRAAGFRMLAGHDADGSAAGRQALLGAATLLPVSLVPTLLGLAGIAHFAGAIVLGAWFFARAAAFAARRDDASARRLLRGSLLYLFLLLALLLLDAGA